MRRGATAGRAATGLPTVDAIATEIGVTAIARAHDMPADEAFAREHGVHRWFLMHVPDATDIPSLCERLAADPGVEHALPNWKLYLRRPRPQCSPLVRSAAIFAIPQTPTS